MRVVTTPEEERFFTEAAKSYYEAAIALEAFQKTGLKLLREVTDEFEAKLSRFGLRFENAIERAGLESNPWIQRKIKIQHLEAAFCLMWFDDDAELKGKRLCVFWWIWLKERTKRDVLGMRMKLAVEKPFEYESASEGTSNISFYFPLSQSAQVKEQARKCTAEFLRVLDGCRKLLSDPTSATGK